MNVSIAGPRPDISPTLLFDFLEVTGGMLLKTYRAQFTKLLQFLCFDYFPKIEQVSILASDLRSIGRIKCWMVMNLGLALWQDINILTTLTNKYIFLYILSFFMSNLQFFTLFWLLARQSTYSLNFIKWFNINYKL